MPSLQHPRGWLDMQHLALITPQNIHSDRQDGRPDAAQVNAYESEIVDDKSSNEYEPQEREYPNIIPEVEDKSIVNVFCFGAFADKTSHSCHWMELCVSWSCTIMKRTPFLLYQYWAWTPKAF